MIGAHRLPRAPLLSSFIAFALMLAGPASARDPLRYDPAFNARLFDRVWSLVERRYWDRDLRGIDWEAARDRYRPQAIAAPDEQHVYAALNAMLDRLGDSHVYAVGPSRLRRIDDRPRKGEALGLGFVAVEEGGDWRISSVAPDSPAARAGIGLGWRLVAVDGRPVNMDYEPADQAIVALSLEDEKGAPRQIAMRLSDYPAEPPWRAARLDNGVLLLSLDDLDRGADRWLVRQLSGGPPPAGVIIDLRENGGGESDVLDRIAGAFFAEKRAVLRLAGRGDEQSEWTKGAGPDAYAGPLVVLVGPRTASAAEAFAALIEESGRGIVVGERTAGRLTGAAHHRLPDGGELSLAENDVRTPGGRRLEADGLVPRHLLRTTLKDRARRDVVLIWAVQLAREPAYSLRQGEKDARHR
jgi:carboxyl-terminal processing protease